MSTLFTEEEMQMTKNKGGSAQPDLSGKAN